MKKIFPILSVFIFCGSPAFAANPMFAKDMQNSIALYVGQGTGAGTLFKLVDPVLWEFEAMTVFMLQYSQPIEFFRLPSRLNFNIVQNFGYEGTKGLSFGGIGVSLDVSLFDWKGFYFGLGVGPYMRDSKDRYVESRLVFGEKVFIGKNILERWRLELFTLHFSNGDFTPVNKGFNYTGLSASYSF